MFVPPPEELTRIRDEAIAYAGIALYRYLPDGTILWADGATVELLGVPGKTAKDLVGVDIGTLFRRVPGQPRLRDMVLEHGRVADFEYHFRTLDGQHRVVLHYAYLVQDPLYDQPTIQVITHDITRRVQAETALHRHQSVFRGVFQAAPFGIEVYTRAGDLVEMNPAARVIFGVDHAHERPPYNLFQDPNFPPSARAQIDAGEQVHIVWPYDFDVIRERGLYPTTRTGTALLQTTITPYPRADESELSGFAIHLRDITAERAAEDQHQVLEARMHETQKLESLGVLAGGIAHDFNNMLTGILGNAGLALMQLTPDSREARWIGRIEASAQRAAELTGELLAYSGRGQFRIAPIDLSALVEELARLLETVLSKNASVTVHTDANPCMMEGDAPQVRQVVMNLTTNAGDALEDRPGQIHLRTGTMHADHAWLASCYGNPDMPPGDYVFVDVADTGVGMDEQTRRRIFDPFFTTRAAGRGLGLAAVLGIVRGHSGVIHVDSAPGQGTTFRVAFPRQAVPTPIQPTPSHQITDLHGRKILVIDDERSVRDVARSILEGAGAQVRVARDGLEGIDVYRQESTHFDVVILDMTMPRMGGQETFRALRRIHRGVRVILSSGFTEQDATIRFGSKGLRGFVQKPYRPTDLLERVSEALRD